MSKELVATVKSVVSGAIQALDSPAVIRGVKVSAAEVMDYAAVPLSFGTSGARAAVNSRSASGGYGFGSTVQNNTYNLVQNNTSPKSLSALDTYQARRQQMAMLKAMM